MASLTSLRVYVLLLAALVACTQLQAAAQQAPSGEGSIPTFRTNVRRVIVDVIVTDKQGKPVPGLTREDFSVFEDGAQQKLLSFDALGFAQAMDYVPPKLPAEPPNTFVNLPLAPEKGPLYVLLYDLVNMESNEEQIFARQQVLKFIEDKPEGTRFAIFIFSDGLHMVQGFTSDKSLLYAAIDPHRSHAHVPKVFLMGKNFGQGDAPTSVWILRTIANYLDGLPGRKNVLWLSGGFPLALFPNEKDNQLYSQEVRQTLDLLARNQIAVYPVDTRGVAVDNPHDPPGTLGNANPYARAGSPGAAGAAGSAAAGIGVSQLTSSYMAEDEVARITGGRAFHSRNDIGVALKQATEDGASYYSMSYAPEDREYDAAPHNIRVELAGKAYSLAYRHVYYALDPHAPLATPELPGALPVQEQAPRRGAGDLLNAFMEHGAPTAHGLIFGARIEPVGQPAMATPAQMEELAEQTQTFRTRKKGSSAKPLPPVKLQEYTVDYQVMTHQLQLAGRAPDLEVAAAAYDGEGKMLNAAVNRAASGSAGSGREQPKSYRAVQVLFVPLNAASMRIGVRDGNTDRMGAMEVPLPLTPEPPRTIEKRTPAPGR